MIPKVLHRIWLGSNPIPEELASYGDSWKIHHPSWDMHLWTDDKVVTLGSEETLSRARNYSEKSDVLRYEILWRFGGVYIDMDVECLRPIDELLDDVSLFAAFERPGRIGSAVVGAEPSHPAMKHAVTEIQRRVGTGKQEEATGPGLLTNTLQQFPDATIFPSRVFYPYDWTERYRKGERFQHSYAVHHWQLSWKTREELLRRVDELQLHLAKTEERLQNSEHKRARSIDREARVTAKLSKAESRLASIEASAPRRLLGRLLRRPGRRARSSGT